MKTGACLINAAQPPRVHCQCAGRARVIRAANDCCGLCGQSCSAFRDDQDTALAANTRVAPRYGERLPKTSLAEIEERLRLARARLAEIAAAVAAEKRK